MATEILQSLYIGQYGTTTPNPKYNTSNTSAFYQALSNDREHPLVIHRPVIHNFQHDLESLFWVRLWISHTRVGHQPSEEYSWELFVPQIRLSNACRDAFLNPQGLNALPEPLHRDLSCTIPHISALRMALFEASTRLTSTKGWLLAESYRVIHSQFSDILHNFHEEYSKLEAVKLTPLGNYPPKMRTREFCGKIDLDQAESTSMIEQVQVQSTSMDRTARPSVGSKRRISRLHNEDRSSKRPRQTRAPPHSNQSKTNGDMTRLKAPPVTISFTAASKGRGVPI